MSPAIWFSLIMFFAIFLLVLSVLLLLFGGERKERKKVKQRLGRIMAQYERETAVSLRRDQYLQGLSPLEQQLESLPGMQPLRRLIEQSGKKRLRAYQVALFSVLLTLITAAVLLLITGFWWLALPLGVLVGWLPVYQLIKLRNTQLLLFEEQLPDALDSITRALKVGHPFNDAMRMISLEMSDPIAGEFALTSAEINYGSDFKTAMLNMLERKPSVSLMAMVASVLIQRETGGNLSEVINNLSGIIRSRFQLQRKVKTLSAEGRLSAWILLLLPFVLMGVISVVNPQYLLPLFQEPLGQKLLAGSGLSIVVGLIWIQKIIKIDF